MRLRLLTLLLIFPIAVGCSKTDFKKKAEPNAMTQRLASVKDAAGGPPHSEELRATTGEAVPAGASQKIEKKDKIDQPRKIRYTADMRLIVEDFAKAEDELDDARKKFKGDWAKKESSSASGGLRSGNYRIRVPVEQFEDFRKAVAKIGEVERHTVDAEDMTAQYYDLEAHIKNRQAARETLRDLLKETGKKEMKHYLEVWDKLERMTDEINRAEGQLRLWANLTDLTTVTVSMREKQKFIAEKKVEEKEVPTFGVRASETWRGSLDAFGDFCQFIAIAAIAVTPWLPIPLVGILFLWLFIRLIVRATRVPVVEVVAEAPAEKKT